ncbi:MAG: hypothetical protein WC091_20005 [Sulfuricellaceae bacterium]
MKAKKIMMIRHAEKPADSGAPFGVDINGNQDAESLIPRGWQRAGALAEFFDPANGCLQDKRLAVPQFLYASGVGKHSNSLRPEETIMPLSEKLGIKINTTFKKGDEADMIQDAMAQDGIVLIAWEHQAIPGIANLIPGNNTIPQTWPGNRFDIVWIFDPAPNNAAYTFSQVPQQLLSGDSNTVI